MEKNNNEKILEYYEKHDILTKANEKKHDDEDDFLKKVYKSQFFSRFVLFVINEFDKKGVATSDDLKKLIESKQLTPPTLYRLVNYLIKYDIARKEWNAGMSFQLIPIKDENGVCKIKKYEKMALKTLDLPKDDYKNIKKLMDFAECEKNE